MKKHILLLSIFISLQITAQNYYYPLGEGGDKSFISVDSDIEVKRIDNKTAWVKMDREKKKIKLKSGKLSTVGDGYFLSLYEIKCKDDVNPITRYKSSNLILYSRDRKVLYSGEESTDWMLIAPDTKAEVVSIFVCEGMIY